ncbi:MAG: aspartate/glutamate racemase family protein [Acidobacteria bacterium]|nr:aspartate/glutamate racemase family protein [Acidobacteriota bacterium]MBI3425809.1 aspartate/glutamate racemase family protein [Acidobacteriota bacterium]
MQNKPRLAMLDWGIGGISVLQQIKARLGDVPVLYLSDTGVTPYGKMSRGALVERLHSVSAFLQTQGATHLVIGCNAASTALPLLKVTDFPIEGVIESAVRMTARLQPARLALIGGRRTVLSGVYRTAFAAQGIEVTQRIAQPLSGLIESGAVSSAELRAQCRRILAPIRNCSHLLLACTHYPAITPVLREFVSAKTVFINPASALVDQLKGWQLPKSGADVFLTTGDAGQMKQAAWRAFRYKIATVARITIKTVSK